jgi:uncharacterized integral membrane protein
MAQRTEPTDGTEQKRAPAAFPSTRTSRAWWTLAAGVVMLLLVIVFIAQNSDHVAVRFLWLKGHMALGVALLFAAILGAATVLLLGAARILQLRRQAKRKVRQASA